MRRGPERNKKKEKLERGEKPRTTAAEGASGAGWCKAKSAREVQGGSSPGYPLPKQSKPFLVCFQGSSLVVGGDQVRLWSGEGQDYSQLEKILMKRPRKNSRVGSTRGGHSGEEHREKPSKIAR